jgi:hypothetical protein
VLRFLPGEEVTMETMETVVRSSISVELRRIGIAIAGFSVLAVGLALVAVPVPGTSIVRFPLGLAILAKEFAWARDLLASSKGVIRRAWLGVRRAFDRSTVFLTPIRCL